MKRLNIWLVLAMVLGFMAMMFISCSTMTGVVKTPQDRALTAMTVYNQTYDDYLVQAARTDLTESEKEVLKATRQALIEVHPVIKAYVNYIETGQTPTAEMEAALLAAVDALTQAAIKEVQ